MRSRSRTFVIKFLASGSWHQVYCEGGRKAFRHAGVLQQGVRQLASGQCCAREAIRLAKKDPIRSHRTGQVRALQEYRGRQGGGSPERALQGLAVDRLSHVWHPCLVLHGVLASLSVLMEGDRASSRQSMLGQVQGAGHGLAKLLREGGFRLGWALAGE